MSDKRTVATDALDTLGTILDEHQKRDAIHLAVEPVVAGQRFLPGDHVTMVSGKAMRVKPGEGIGIVDPFLTTTVREGERFWLVMYPRQVTSLRHVWSHPAFPDEQAVRLSFDAPLLPPLPPGNVPAPERRTFPREVEWLQNFARSLGLDYDELMDAAHRYLAHGYRKHIDVYYDEERNLGGEWPLFWWLYCEVLGIPRISETRGFIEGDPTDECKAMKCDS